jgi:hypothetical protein
LGYRPTLPLISKENPMHPQTRCRLWMRLLCRARTMPWRVQFVGRYARLDQVMTHTSWPAGSEVVVLPEHEVPDRKQREV